MTRRKEQDGAAVVVALAVVGALIALACLGVAIAAAVAFHRRAESAADLAALAGAGALQSGGDACAAAARIARANDTVLRSCARDGTAVSVVVRMRLPAVLGGRELAARARAGPAP